MEGLGAAVDERQGDVVTGGEVEHGGDGAGIEEGHVAASDENVVVGGAVQGGVHAGESAAVGEGVGMVGVGVGGWWLAADLDDFPADGSEGIEDDLADGGLAEAGHCDGHEGLVLTHAAALAAGEHGSGGVAKGGGIGKGIRWGLRGLQGGSGR